MHIIIQLHSALHTSPYDMQICTNVGRSWRKLCTATGQSEIHRYIFIETRENKSISARVSFEKVFLYSAKFLPQNLHDLARGISGKLYFSVGFTRSNTP